MILRQCLTALKYLHGPSLTIVHRDIKPENILVQSRNRNHIEVKLADFGLSKDYDNLSTFCGTPRYLAPEVYRVRQFAQGGGVNRVSYDSAVDIWSLGTVLYELLCSFPRWNKEYIFSGTAWAEAVLETFENDYEERPDELRKFLLETMVVIQADDRWSAEQCHINAELLLVAILDRFEKPTPASSSSIGSELRTIQYWPDQKTIEEDQQNTTRPRTTYKIVSGSTDAHRQISAGAPPPGSSMPANRKRQVTPSASPSQRRNKRRADHSSTTRSAVPDNRTHDSDPEGDKTASGRRPDVINPLLVQTPQIESILEDPEALDAARLLQAMSREPPNE